MSANTYGVSDEQIAQLDAGDLIYIDANEEVSVLGVIGKSRRIGVEKHDGTLDVISYDQVSLEN